MHLQDETKKKRVDPFSLMMFSLDLLKEKNGEKKANPTRMFSTQELCVYMWLESLTEEKVDDVRKFFCEGEKEEGRPIAIQSFCIIDSAGFC